MKNNKIVLTEKEKEEIFKQNENLIKYVIKVMAPNYPDKEELFAIGSNGLMNAINYFDFSKKTKFSTYAYKCISTRIGNFFRDKNAMFRQTDKLTVSLNEIIFEGDERNIRIEDTLVMADPYSFVDHYIHKEELKEVFSSFKYLTPKQQVCLRYWLAYEKDYSALTPYFKELNMTRQCFYMIADAARKKLQLIYKSENDCTEEELIRRDKFLNTEYPIVKSIQELKKYNRVKEIQAKSK